MHCPCGSQSEYQNCCKVYHDGGLPENPLKLLRSRFSAYILNLPEFIISTTHPASPIYQADVESWKRQIGYFIRRTIFHSLEILDRKENPQYGFIAFATQFTQKGEQYIVTERSLFEKVNSAWLYKSGELFEGRVPVALPGTMQILPLAYYGKTVLRKKAIPVGKITEEIRQLVHAMVETLDAYSGAGLAAPQVQHSLRLFIVKQPIETEDRIEYGEEKVFINPEIAPIGRAIIAREEGCLSIPSIRGTVERAQRIKATYTNLQGRVICEEITGLEARCVQHENDHLDGVLFIDKVREAERIEIKPQLKKLQNRLHTLIVK